MTDTTTAGSPLRRLTMDQLMDRELELAKAQAEVEGFRREVKTEILRQLTATGFQVGQSFIRADGVSASIQVRAGSKKIDRQKLILAGVDEDVVDDATVQGAASAPFIVVYLPKGKKDADDSVWDTGMSTTLDPTPNTRRS